MNYKKILVVLTSVFMLALAAGAQEIQFKCNECHESAKEILPDKHIKKEKFEGCFSCHQKGKKIQLSRKIHEVHLNSEGTSTDTCLSCHADSGDGTIIINSSTGQKVYTEDTAPVMGSFYKEGSLANSHKNAGYLCTGCHEKFDFDEYDAMGKKCIECHGDYPEVAKRTANTAYETNPHQSHFPNLSCVKCHSMHGEFKDYCSGKCHKWGFSWKQKLKG